MDEVSEDVEQKRKKSRESETKKKKEEVEEEKKHLWKEKVSQTVFYYKDYLLRLSLPDWQECRIG